MYTHCKNLFGVTKLVLLKVSVGAIVLEGLIEQFIVMAGAEPYNDDSTFDAEEKTQRGYCALVLLEFAILSFLYYYAYSQKITAPPASSNSNAQVNSSSSASEERMSFCGFLCAIFSFRDVFGLLTYNDTLAEPLTAVQQKL